MENFNPNRHRSQCEKYLSQALNRPVRLLNAERLTKSTREAPWRLDVEVNSEQRKYVLRLDSRRAEHEYEVLQRMESILIPTPGVYGWDAKGDALGVPCFCSDFIEGESLLKPMLAGEVWAGELFIDTVCALQKITREDLFGLDHLFENEDTADNILDTAYGYFKTNPDALADAVYRKLKDTMPVLPAAKFSNGDLWLDNMIIRDKKLVGVIDFENAGFSDPIFEFLLPFFVSPDLRGRGIEARYLERIGFNEDILNWYHGLEYFDTWHWVRSTGESFVHYNEQNLSTALRSWLVDN